MLASHVGPLGCVDGGRSRIAEHSALPRRSGDDDGTPSVVQQRRSPVGALVPSGLTVCSPSLPKVGAEGLLSAPLRAVP